MNNLINDYAAWTKEKIARQLWCTITADDVEGTLFQVGKNINLLNRVAFDWGCWLSLIAHKECQRF
jgi:hypothetical protein